jgi:hypothetical protein
MRYLRSSALLGCAVAASLSLACGEERMERGLAPSVEAAVPDSEAEDEMTEKERREQEVRALHSTEPVIDETD